MLQYETAVRLYEEISRKAAARTTEGFDEFYRGFLKNAVDYAATRTAWSFLTPAERSADDSARSIRHDGFMTRLSILCSRLGITGIDEILPDRKTRGDFACYIALFLALEQR